MSSRQIGEQKSRGIELDIAGEILPGWQIITNYAYLDTEVLSDTNELDNEDFTENQLRNVPENAVTIWVWEQVLIDVISFSAALGTLLITKIPSHTKGKQQDTETK